MDIQNARDVKQWYPIDTCDMSHIKDAVVYWNEEGRFKGPLSPEVREWMKDSDNYYLEYYGYNRSQGGNIKETYMPPVSQGE